MLLPEQLSEMQSDEKIVIPHALYSNTLSNELCT
jgi:hypothetical protein